MDSMRFRNPSKGSLFAMPPDQKWEQRRINRFEWVWLIGGYFSHTLACQEAELEAFSASALAVAVCVCHGPLKPVSVCVVAQKLKFAIVKHAAWGATEYKHVTELFLYFQQAQNIF